MKKILLRTVFSFFLFQLSIINVKAQLVTIPDSNFVAFLTQNYPQCMTGNQMNTSCTAIVNATSLNCSYKNIASLSGLQYFTSLTFLTCFGNVLTSLPSLRVGMREVKCSNNQLTSLPALPSTLQTLECGDNQLTNLPALPAGLIRLDCGTNPLGSLPGLPSTLVYLFCSNADLSSLPGLPGSLSELTCSSNNLHNLPTLPAGLIYLGCSNNPLYSLPALPNTLQILYCQQDSLTTLPTLSASLINMDCSYNQLTGIPTLPGMVRSINCHDNQLTSLPALPPSLESLDCNDNQLTTLPALPSAKMGILNCGSNPISSLPELPDTITYSCSFYNCPLLSCLPELKKIAQLDFRGTLVTCLPNYGSVTTSYPPLAFFPLCDTFNSSGCDILWNISGNAFYEAGSNCTKDITDTAQRNILIQLNKGGILVEQISTGGQGYYSFNVDTGTYEISVDTTNIPFRVYCPSSNLLTSSISLLDSLDYSKDFALKCKSGFDLTAWSIWAGFFRPANFTAVDIHAGDLSNFYGVHCATGVSGTVTVTINGSATYASPANGALTPIVSGNVLTYNIADFATVNFNRDFNMVVQTDTSAVAGSQICFNVSVTPTAGDNNPANNSFTHCFTVIASYDPNNKQVSPTADIDTTQKWLTYTVNFQNTGTAEAQHIYVTDTLDADLDASSFQLLAYSHQPLVQIKENAVRFNFPNINLPDSNTNEPLSHGYVQYKIKLKDNLPIGTEINNTAYIYFDFNEPVVTNTTSNTIAVVSSAPSIGNPQSAIRIYPNPANNFVTISVDENLVGSVAAVTDITGRRMMAVQLQTPNTKLETQNFSNGVYFVTVSASDGRSVTKKLVVSK